MIPDDGNAPNAECHHPNPLKTVLEKSCLRDQLWTPLVASTTSIVGRPSVGVRSWEIFLFFFFSFERLDDISLD